MGEPSNAVRLLGARPWNRLLALDEALDALSWMDARKGRVTALRYLGGLNLEETAEFLRILPETVRRAWRMAKAWLLGELTGK